MSLRHDGRCPWGCGAAQALAAGVKPHSMAAMLHLDAVGLLRGVMQAVPLARLLPCS